MSSASKSGKTNSGAAEKESRGGKQTLTGARILWECLEREGVTVVFGYPGGAILPAYDALRKKARSMRAVPRLTSGAEIHTNPTPNTRPRPSTVFENVPTKPETA